MSMSDADNDGECHQGLHSQPDEEITPLKLPNPDPDPEQEICTPEKQGCHAAKAWESSPEPSPTRIPLQERLKRNKQRNEAKLAELGLAFGIKPRPRKQPRCPSSTPLVMDEETASSAGTDLQEQEQIPATRGRELLAVESILASYPCRAPQIMELHSLLRSCPQGGPSIFITGPRGTGKTAIVTDLLRGIPHGTYVDCASLSTSGNNCDADLFSRIYMQHTGQKDTPSPARQSVWNLHLSLQQQAHRYRLTVLDHAERISPSTLRQFLLLPDTQMVLISRSYLLQYAERMSTACPTATVHFGAYRTSAAWKEILLCQSNQRSVTGSSELKGLECQAYPAFLETVIQAIQDMTSDVRDYIGLGRSLWPRYTEPLRPHRIKETLQGQNRLSVREVVSVLDQKIMPVLRKEMQSIGQSHVLHLQGDSSIPLNVYFLVLAAYICQLNHPNRDKQLFLIQKNGRRSGRKEPVDVPPPNRPRSFPSERLYSIYVSLIHLHSRGMGSGSTEFFQTIRSFLDMEILRESRAHMFTSSVTKEEAHSIALVVKVPLEQYTA